MRIDMETWLGLTLRSSGRVCDIRSKVAHVQLLRTLTKFVGLLRSMETKNFPYLRNKGGSQWGQL